MPVGQGGQYVWPENSWYVPLTEQFVHTVRPVVALNEPGLQSVHDAMTVAPVLTPILPAGQGVHALTPAVPDHVPGRQDRQVLFREAPVVAEYLPVLQSVHISEVNPEPVKYLPVPHNEQVPVTNAPENLPARQLWHTLALLPPVDAVYFPTPHEVQKLLPVPAIYDPAGQAVQDA